MMLTNNDQLVVRIRKDDTEFIRVFNLHTEDLVQEIQPQCQHGQLFVCIAKHPTDINCMLESCWECKVIRSYNLNTGKCKVVFSDFWVFSMCEGPGDTMFTYEFYHLSQLQWNTQKEKLQLVETWQQNTAILNDMCFIKNNNLLVLLHQDKMKAMTVGEELTTLWESTPDPPLRLDSAKSDQIEHDVYVGDGGNSRILMIDSLTGDILNEFKLEESSEQTCVLWSDTDRNLVVHRGNVIANYSIVQEQ